MDWNMVREIKIAELNEQIEICKRSGNVKRLNRLARAKMRLMNSNGESLGGVLYILSLLGGFILGVPWLVMNWGTIFPYLDMVFCYVLWPLGGVFSVFTLVGLFMPDGTWWRDVSEEICSK